MILVSAKIGPFRSMNTVQTIAFDPKVTVFVGMNEAGKTVILKALEKSADALQQEGFEVVEDYPRKELTSYQKRHKTEPAAVTVLTYSLDDDETASINAKLGTSIPSGFTFSVTHKYDGERTIGMSVDEGPVVAAIVQSLSADAAAALSGVKTLRDIPTKLVGVELTANDNAVLDTLNARIKATTWPKIIEYEVWLLLDSSTPKFLYFSDYDLLPGKMNLAELAQRVEQAKSDPKALKPKHRSVLALLRMADVAVTDFATPGSYEELKAKIEGVSINLTDQVMEFWKQNEDLEVEVDIKADATDEAPYNNGSNLYLRI